MYPRLQWATYKIKHCIIVVAQSNFWGGQFQPFQSQTFLLGTRREPVRRTQTSPEEEDKQADGPNQWQQAVDPACNPNGPLQGQETEGRSLKARTRAAFIFKVSATRYRIWLGCKYMWCVCIVCLENPAVVFKELTVNLSN